MCIENAKPLNYGITHHRWLEHVSTARCTLLTRSDIIIMCQPVWMSLLLSFLSISLYLCLCSVSIYSPLLFCTSLQLPVFCSFGLFSLHLSRLFLSFPICPSLSLSLSPVRHPSICSRLQSYLCEWSSLGRAVTIAHTGGEVLYWETRYMEKNNCSALPLGFLSLPLLTPCHSGICSLLLYPIYSLSKFPHTFLLEINTGCLLCGINVVISEPAILETINIAGYCKQTRKS